MSRSSISRYLSLTFLSLLLVQCGGSSGTDKTSTASRLHLTLGSYGTLTPTVGEKMYTLTLENVSPSLLWFDDRPLTNSGETSLSGYVADWNASYGKVMPNGVIDAYLDGTTDEIGLYIELGNPVYDAENKRLTFTVVLMNQTFAEAPTSAVALDGVKLTILNNDPDGRDDGWSYLFTSEFAQFDTVESGGYTLTFSGVAPVMYEVGNAPNRQSALSGVQSLVDLWNLRFADSPPTSVMTSYTAEGAVVAQVVTLSSPVYDATAGNLRFNGTLLHGDAVAGTALTVPTILIDQVNEIGSGNRSVKITNSTGTDIWIGGYLKVRQPVGDSIVMTNDPRTGWKMAAGDVTLVRVPDTINGSRFWVRTGCVADQREIITSAPGAATVTYKKIDALRCVTGDCFSAAITKEGVPVAYCQGVTGQDPSSSFEITMGHNPQGADEAAKHGNDFYDISNVDGFHMASAVKPATGFTPVSSGDPAADAYFCKSTKSNDIGCGFTFDSCPDELKKTVNGVVVGCYSICKAATDNDQRFLVAQAWADRGTEKLSATTSENLKRWDASGTYDTYADLVVSMTVSENGQNVSKWVVKPHVQSLVCCDCGVSHGSGADACGQKGCWYGCTPHQDFVADYGAGNCPAPDVTGHQSDAAQTPICNMTVARQKQDARCYVEAWPNPSSTWCAAKGYTGADCSYQRLYKKPCPDAYSWQFDDPTSTWQCKDASYEVIFGASTF